MFEKTCRIGSEVVIGYSPENEARQIRFDCSKFFELWPGAVPVMMITRPGESDAYKAETKVEGKDLVWTIGSRDTEIPGTGEMWIAFRRESDKLLGIAPATSIVIKRGPPDIPANRR